jgi:hypothetical protein
MDLTKVVTTLAYRISKSIQSLTIELLSLFILFGLFEASTNPFALPTA